MLNCFQSKHTISGGAGGGAGGAGGFFLARDDFWENVRPFIPRLRFFSSFFLKWRLARAH